jgi:hypothetical protein
VEQGETRKSLDLDQMISATQVPMVSASELSLNRRHSMKSLREVGGSDQNGYGHIGVGSIHAVLGFTPLTRRIEMDLRERKTGDRNGVTIEKLSLVVDTESRQPAASLLMEGLPKKQMPLGKPEDRLTSVR